MRNLSEMNDDYGKHYSEKKFWAKIKKFGKAIGKQLVEKCLILYYVGIDPNTPAWAKSVVFVTLGYVIWPLDAIPDITPIVG